MANLNLLPSKTPSDGAWAAAVPSSIRTTAATAAAAAAAATGAPAMGQKDFLTLFTTQLKNQDPLDPVKNEAFVAQLAQFSQLEATTNMSSTLTSFVDSMGRRPAWKISSPMPCSAQINKRPFIPPFEAEGIFVF